MSAAPKWADDASCFFCIPGRPCREHAVIPFRQRLQDAGIIKDKPPHNPAAPPAGTPNQAYAVATL
ncbi:MAG TPA: hypothetical protein VFI55_08125, partial [Mycobacterium sp.]|nr:hypothetical protein [Mycobacterium sp.]